ncbi:uncharacterized protein [Rutidosis leptorrhynchoides]|uniref:uncharacterized protein n=1 Tax=Rutidosis leptorrhynchoides TaxID=125765 RepID=UPI003A995A03
MQNEVQAQKEAKKKEKMLEASWYTPNEERKPPQVYRIIISYKSSILTRRGFQQVAFNSHRSRLTKEKKKGKKVASGDKSTWLKKTIVLSSREGWLYSFGPNYQLKYLDLLR